MATTTASSDKPVGLYFPWAGQPEIVRAGQKDAYYIAQLRGYLENVLRTVLGTRWLAGNDDRVQLLTDSIYLGLTTFLGSQTLGEEYIDILQYSVKTKRLPTKLRRLALVLVHILLPYTVRTLWSALRRRSTAAEEEGEPSHHRLEGYLAKIGSILPTYETVFGTNLRAVHLAVFYLTGRYYDLSKRLTGIRYIFTRQLRPGESEGSSYQVLGVLLLTQVIVRAFVALLRLVRRRPPLGSATSGKDKEKLGTDRKETQVESVLPHKPGEAAPGQELDLTALDLSRLSAKDHADRKCILCLEERRSTTSADCGHLFCWECIVGWVRTRKECPLCRQSVVLQHLVPLYNV